MTAIDTDRLWLTTGEIAQLAGLPVAKVTLWQTRTGAITPSIMCGRGSGYRHGWSQRDLDVLRAIAKVRYDLDQLGCPMPTELVMRLWQMLHADGRVDISGTTIDLHVEL